MARTEALIFPPDYKAYKQLAPEEGRVGWKVTDINKMYDNVKGIKSLRIVGNLD